MKRLVRFWPVFLLLFAASYASPTTTEDKDSPEAIKTRLQERLDEIAKKASPHVLVIPIREMISISTAVYVEREMGRVKEDGFDLVLVEIHTPGGWSDAMTRIADAFRRSLSENNVPVIAFINHEAFSAGAIISLGTDRIYIAPNGKIGAASGYVIGPDGVPIKLPPDVAEKFSSAFRAEARALAKSKGYPPAIAEAFVDRAKEVTEVEVDGKREYLSEKEFDNRRRELGINKLPPLEAEERMKVIRTVCEKGELLTLDYEEAREVGLAVDVLDSRDEVLAALGVRNAQVVEATHNWSEHVFGFLASPAVKAILLILGLMGLYVEFKVPGFGLPGIFGICCLGLFFFSQYFMGLANYTGVIVFVIGVVLLLIEIFAIPGFGVTGMTGIVCVVVGIFLGMQPFVVPEITNPWNVELFKMNVLVLGAALTAVVILMVVLAKYLPSTPFLSRLILTAQSSEGEPRASGTGESKGGVGVGESGKTISRLRPAGRAAFGEKLLDVVAEGQFIDEGATVEVMKIQGNRVVVRKVD